MCDVTIICCYNKLNVYEKFLDTLKNQTCKFKIIALDNTGNSNFKSCAQAYNQATKNVDTKFIIYSHQDILLNQKDTLEKFLSYLNKIGSNDILGVAGVKIDKPGVFTNIRGLYNEFKKSDISGDYRIDKNQMIALDVIDECFFGGYTQNFLNNPFNEILCDNWHLYSVERCLNARKNNNKVFACDIDLTHYSSGTLNGDFRKGFYKLSRFYAHDFKFIRTCCDYSKTNFFSALMHYICPVHFSDLTYIFLTKTGLLKIVKKILGRK